MSFLLDRGDRARAELTGRGTVHAHPASGQSAAAFMAWLHAFVFTQIIEVPIYLFALRRGAVAFPRIPRVAIAFGASALTHPVVWFVFPEIFGHRHYVSMVAAAEIFAVLAETYWFSTFGLRRPFTWALVANAASLGIGLALRSQFGWP